MPSKWRASKSGNDMGHALKTWEKIAAVLHDVFRRHWRRALIVRDWFRLSEEGVHLVLAGVVGILAGLANWVYFLSNQLVQFLLMGRTGDVLMAASEMEVWRRLLVPAAGGLAAGLALYWGL